MHEATKRIILAQVIDVWMKHALLIFLHVSKNGERARGLATRLGFRVIGVKLNIYFKYGVLMDGEQ
jgi:ribosomal protein S18 acetylase RimI-like enzyme